MLIKEPKFVNRYKYILTLLLKFHKENIGHQKTDIARIEFLEKGLEFRVTKGQYKDPYIFIIKIKPDVSFLHIDGIRKQKHESFSNPDHPVFQCDDLTQIYEDNKEFILEKFRAHKWKTKKFQTLNLYDL